MRPLLDHREGTPFLGRSTGLKHCSGDLGQEQYTTSVDVDYGLPYRSYGGLAGVGTVEYALDTLYTKYGEPERVELGEQPLRVWKSLFYEDDTRRLKRIATDAEKARPVVADVNYTLDPSANVTSIVDAADLTVDAVPDKQCFAYDHLQRLTEAWIPKTDCSAPRSKEALNGPAPYWQSFTYDKIGNRRTETQHAAVGDTVRTYTYPQSGRKLQAVDSTGPAGAKRDEFGYDDTGNTTRRKIFNSEQALDWDLEGRLTKVTEADKQTDFVYDANGSRLIRRDPSGTTLYLPGQELHVDKAGVKRATRYYTFAGAVIAVRTGSGLSWQTGDHQGTAQVSVDAKSLEVTRRRQTPFGGSRGQVSPFPGSKGFVGGTIDASVGLVTLGARQYDPAVGRFISVDPLMDLTNPQQMQGYSYANNSPVTLSDPSGLRPAGCEEWGLNCRTQEPLNRPIPPGSVRMPPGGGGEKKPQYPKQFSGAITKATPKQRRGFLEGHFNTYSAAPDRPPWYGEFKEAFCYEFPDNGYCIGPTPEGALQVAALFLPYGFVAKTLTKVVGAGIAARAATPELGGAVAAGASAAGASATAARVAAAGCSFVPGTRVLMADGTSKPIEQLQVGDMVLATDPETGETGPREVLAPLSSQGLKTLIQITIDTDGDAGDKTSTLTATDNHPFWAPDLRTWVTASELRAGSLLWTSVGMGVRVTAVRSWTGRQNVYNLTIDDIHTYYALAGDAPVLVHNTNGCPTGTVWDDIAGTQPAIPGTGGLPKSFELKAGESRVWVHGNVTDHFAEMANSMAARGLSPEKIGLATQQQLRSLQAAVSGATRGGVPLNQRMTLGGWQLEFRQGPGDALPALIHGRYVG